jgi:hypothetical protein
VTGGGRRLFSHQVVSELGNLFVYCGQRRAEEDRVTEDSVMIVCR